jgi:queuosine precursor transporter
VLIGAFLNAYVLTKWKILWRGRYFWLRSLFSTAFGELIFTTIVILVNYFGVFDFKNMFELGVVSFCFKIIMSVVLTVPISLFVVWLKNKEGVDIYDYHTNFNPFKADKSND